MLILNTRELEECLLNKWERVISSIPTTKRLDVVFHEPDDNNAGTWIWESESKYHFLIRNSDGVLLSKDTGSFNEIETLVFQGPITHLAVLMGGDVEHNLKELGTLISKSFSKDIRAMIDEGSIPLGYDDSDDDSEPDEDSLSLKE